MDDEGEINHVTEKMRKMREGDGQNICDELLGRFLLCVR